MDFLKTPEMRLHDDAKIQDIIDEFNSGERDDVAWAKALKGAKGNTSYAQALYIDERIKRLADFQHIIAADQKEKRLKYLEEAITEIGKVEAYHSKILFVLLILCILFIGILFGEGDVELGAAVLFILCGGVFAWRVKRSGFDKEREELKSQLEKISPPPEQSSWLGPLFVLAALGVTFYFWG